MLKRLLFASFLAFASVSVYAQGTELSLVDFNSSTDLPAGYSQTTLATDGGWIVGDPGDLGSSAFGVPANDGNAIVTNDDGCDCDKSADILVLAPLDLSAVTSVYLLFDLFYIDGSYQGAQESLELLASTDDGTTWASIQSFEGSFFWHLESVDLSAYAGNANLKLAIKYNDGGGWTYGAAIDNIKLVEPDNVLRASLAYADAGRYVEAVPAVIGGYSKFWAGGHFSVEGAISNNGFVPITSFTASWTKGAETVSQEYTGLNIPFTKSYTFLLDLGEIALGSNSDNYTISISNINGGEDNDLTDNSTDVTVTVEGVEPVAGRKVVLEEATGTWCQWCPRGAVFMDFLHEEYPTLAIPIAVHNADPMVVSAYDTGIGALIGGYPSGLVDRYQGEEDPSDFEKKLITRLTTPPPVSVQHNVTYDAATRVITVGSQVQFLQDMNGNFRIAVVVTEDDVTGTSSTYRQVNTYSGGGNGPMGGFEDLANPVPAAQMVYNHVARYINGFTGAAGSVPATNPAGSIVTFTGTYTHPVAQEIGQMHAITMLINTTTGEIVNAEETAIPFNSVATHAPSSVIGVDVYPNPVSAIATVALNLAEAKDVQLRMTDVSGKVVYEANMGKMTTGEHKLPVRVQHLNAGTYMMTVNTGGEITTKPVVVVK